MPQSDKHRFPPMIPFICIEEVAMLAGISVDRVEYFADEFQLLLDHVIILHETRSDRAVVERKIKGELDDVAELSSKLVEVLRGLTGGAQERMLKRLMKEEGSFPGEDEYMAWAEHLSELTRHLKVLSDGAQEKRGSGAPRRSERPEPLDRLIDSLQLKIICFGGAVTFSKTDGAGTLTEILRRLAPYLPSGLIPEWILTPDEFLDREGASRIYHVKKNNSMRWRFIEELVEEIAHPEPVPLSLKGKAMFFSSGRVRNLRRIGEKHPRPTFELVCPVSNKMPSLKDRTKIRWKKA